MNPVRRRRLAVAGLVLLAAAAAAEGLPWLGAIYLLAAGLALSLVLAPLAAATALRIALS